MGASDKEQEEEKSSKTLGTKGDEPSTGGSDRPAASPSDAPKAKPVENGETKSEPAAASKSEPPKPAAASKSEPPKSKSEPPKEAVKEEESAASAKTAEAPTTGAPSAVAAEDGDDEEDEEDEEDELAEEEASAEGMPAAESKPAPASKPAPKPAPAAKKAGVGAARPKARAKGVAAPRPPSGSLTKNMILFIVIIGALAAGFAYLGKEEPAGAPPTPKWTVGQTVDVEITLVPNDVKELACAAPDDIAGKHCAFDAQAKPTTKIDPNDDKKLLRPYTTTDRIQFAAAGLWSQESLSKGKLPTTRFSVKCKYAIEGKLKNPNIRWSSAQPEQWFPQTGEWYAGSVSNCILAPP